MNNTVENFEDFERPETITIDITVKGKTAQYQVSELPDADVQRVFRTTDAKGNTDPKMVESFNARVIAACVHRADGTPVTQEQARAMRQPLTQALVRAVMEVHGIGEDVNKQVDDLAGN